MIGFRQKGDFSKTYSFLNKYKKGVEIRSLEEYGRKGVLGNGGFLVGKPLEYHLAEHLGYGCLRTDD